MNATVLLLMFLLKFYGVQARPQIAPFRLLQSSTSWGIGEPRRLPDLSIVENLPQSSSAVQLGSAGFTLCNKILTLIPHEVFTFTFPVDSKSCLIYLKAPKGYFVEQRNHPIVRFSGCDREQLRFSSDQSSLTYCDGGFALHFPSDQSNVAMMYQGLTKDYRQEIQLAVSVKPVDSSLPGYVRNFRTGSSQLVWRDPEEHRSVSNFDDARYNETLQICPGTCGASVHQTADFVKATQVKEGELPYLVRVQVIHQPSRSRTPVVTTCGGSILNSFTVLTGANCMLDEERRRWRVLSRKVFLPDMEYDNYLDGEEGIDFTYVAHPEYSKRLTQYYTRTYLAYDIAVLTLAKEIPLGPYSWPICLAPPLDFINKHAVVTGYHTENQGIPAWKAAVVIADYDKKCKDADGYKRQSNMDHKVCSFGLSKEECDGDGGNPLAISHSSVWYQVGVSTSGFCGEPGAPHFHVNATTFLDFIKKNVVKGGCR